MAALRTILLLPFLTGIMALGQTPSFIYTDYDPNFDSKVVLTQLDAQNHGDQEVERSPYGTRGYWTNSPDFMVASPWSTSIVIEKDEQTSLKLDLRHHANIFPRIVWLNEELLHIQVWWGRAVGSEFILHVPTGDYIYKSMFYWTQVMATTGLELTDLPNFSFTLEHLQGAPPADFHSFSVSRLVSDYDDVRQVSLEVTQPVYTECFLAAQVAELTEVYSLLQRFITERELNAPPRPTETVCRNCTIYQLSWSIGDSEPEAFDFSEQRPFRYPALDGLFPLIDRLVERMRRDGECGA